MKRFKYILLASIIACAFGCQKETIDFVPIEPENQDTVIIVEPEPTQTTQVVDDETGDNNAPVEDIENETVSYFGIEEIDEYIEKTLVLSADEEIEACEKIKPYSLEDDCEYYRVRIGYKEQPENEYKHKRDMFIIRKNEIISIMVDYPSKSDYDAPRYVYDACDFEAKIEDVNFDGFNDLLISLGSANNGGYYWCAYLYERGNYVYNESFERISAYELEYTSKLIISSYIRQATPIEDIYKFDEVKNEFVMVCSYEGMNGHLYRLIADLIIYDEYDDDDYHNRKDYSIVYHYGEMIDPYETYVNKNGNEVYLYTKMPIDDLESFYKNVYGENRTFEAGYDSTIEVGIVCKDDGYAYSYNGIGWGEYPVITDVVESGEGVEIKCDVINAYMGNYLGKISFTMIPSDNKFGYSLKKDTVVYNNCYSPIWAFFENSNYEKLEKEDFSFKYNNNTFDNKSVWSDYVDALGYPKNYEENNYGYISTTSRGYFWGMCYPVQSEANYDFYVVMASDSGQREGDDTRVDHITLIKTPTYRGIKAGDSISDLAAAYGKPDMISFHDGLEVDEWRDLIYENEDGKIVFVVENNKIKFINIYT